MLPPSQSVHVKQVEQVEQVYLPVNRYFDACGNPTCAANFETGEVCRFLAASRFGAFGTREACVLRVDGLILRRTSSEGVPGGGTIIPGSWCPLHGEKKEAFEEDVLRDGWVYEGIEEGEV